MSDTIKEKMIAALESHKPQTDVAQKPAANTQRGTFYPLSIINISRRSITKACKQLCISRKKYKKRLKIEKRIAYANSA